MVLLDEGSLNPFFVIFFTPRSEQGYTAATVVEVIVSAADFALTKTFAQFSDAQAEVERVVAQDDQIIPFVWVSHENLEAVH